MNQMDRLERELTTWFVDTAVPRTPDYTDDILRQTARIRQRPRWTFPRRWLPMGLTTLERVPVKPVPWRTIGLLTIIALLLVATAAVFVGSQPRLPAPFGPAANGLVAYAHNGDIYTVDPVTEMRRVIVTGPEMDHDPRWSLDGARLVFLRAKGGGDIPVVANADGSDQIVAKTEPLDAADTDSIAWSPDGRTIAIAADLDGSRAIYFVDAIDGDVTILATDYLSLEVHWRPPDGRQLLFLGGTSASPRLILYSLEDGIAREIPISGEDDPDLRPAGWTPDGRRFAFHRGSAELDEVRTHLVDVATGAETIVPVAFGHVSNDGTRIAGFNEDGSRTWLCVARIDGGPCLRIGMEAPPPGATHHAGLQWSPDDEWLLTRPVLGGPAVLVDPDGGRPDQPSWLTDGAESWQRLAP
jgi:dipeptidyl aminopeptidase/acylaminoacyl peptidase